MNKLILFMAVVASFFLSAANFLYPYAIDMFPGIVPKGTLNFGAFIRTSDVLNYGYTNLSLTPLGVIGYGFAPNADVRLQGLLSKMILRYDFSFGQNLLIGGLGIDGSSIEPRYDLFFAAGLFALELNATARVPFVRTDSNYLIKVLVAPVVRLHSLALYLEAVSSWSSTGYGLDIVPGLQWNAGTYGCSLAVSYMDLMKTSQQLAIKTLFWFSVPTSPDQKQKDTNSLLNG